MQTIDIQTTQNVTIEYELASLRERIQAFFIDIFIVLAFYFIIFILVMTAFNKELSESALGMNALVGLLPILGMIVYHFLSEVLAGGRSWGKKSMGLRVVRLDGQEPSITDYLLRAVFYLVDVIFSLGVLGSLLISSTRKNQRMGDLAANTAVIRTSSFQNFRLSDILSIDTTEVYTPVYPEVKKLSEQDMLLVKNVISRYQSFNNEVHARAIHELCERLGSLLQVEVPKKDKIGFLRTLLKDYIVLTR